MFLSIVRVGVIASAALVLSSCGGSSGQAETQQSTPEGLFTGGYGSCTTLFSGASIATTTAATAACTQYTPPASAVAAAIAAGNPPPPIAQLQQNMVMFVVANGGFYLFYTEPGTYSPIVGAMQGTLSFGGGTMSATNVLDVNLQDKTVFDPTAGTAPTFNGGYTTGVDVSGYFSYPVPVAVNPAQLPSGTNVVGYNQVVGFNLPYNVDYQGVQNLGTLEGTYTGIVGTSGSGMYDSATFTFGPASVPANSGNQYGVGTLTGTDLAGCTYTGTVSPLYKGNGYTTNITSGGYPCRLPNTQFTGLIYYDTTNNLLYSFAPDTARTDGLIFTGSRIKSN